MKPGDLVRWREEYLSGEHSDDDFYRGKVGVILGLYEDPLRDRYQQRIYDILLDGQIVGGFEYEMEVIDETETG